VNKPKKTKVIKRRKHLIKGNKKEKKEYYIDIIRAT
jgi:hypothetical protein